jgi:hypothetical protein
MTTTPSSPVTRRPISRRILTRAGVAAGAALALAIPLAGGAQAATPNVNLASLESALDALPGVNAGQVQALVGDLGAVANGGSPTTLGTDLDNVLGTIATDSGDSQLLASVETAVNNLLDGTATPSDIDAIVEELETLANQSGVPATVDNAVDELADGLTGADLEQILSQAGSPLSAQQVQEIIGELDTLEGLAPSANVPAGALSALASALDTIASQPGVPAAVASTLEDVAGTLDSGPLSPSTVASTVPALDGAVPSLDSVPITGPALGSLVGSLGTELGASPAGGSGGAGASGGAGGAGGSGAGAGGSASASATVGVTISKVSYSGGKVHVAMTCPKSLTSGCRSTVYLHVGSWREAIATVTIKAGAKHTVNAGLPHLAMAAAKNHKLTVTINATTGSVTSHSHTLHIRLAAKATAKTK